MLGLLLFLVLINDAGFDNKSNNAEIITSKKNFKAANQIHLKYVDDMTIAETSKLKDKLVPLPETQRPLPDNYHARTGHALPAEKSNVYKQLISTIHYAENDDMKINLKNE